MKTKVISNQWTGGRRTTAGAHRALRAACTCFLGLIAMGLLPGCSSTHIKSASNPGSMTEGPFRNVMVVGVDERGDIRNPFENDAVAFLKEHGVEGNASHDRFSLDEFKGDREQIRQKLVAAKVESVLSVRVTDQTDSAAGAPPVTLDTISQGAVAESAYNALTMPGGSDNYHVCLAARLYRVSDGMVVWSGMMNTFVKEDYDSIVLLRGVARTIVERMAKDKMIP